MYKFRQSNDDGSLSSDDAVWCFIANRLSNHTIIKMSLEKYGHIVTPFVFILLGIYIMYESNRFDLFLNN